MPLLAGKLERGKINLVPRAFPLKKWVGRERVLFQLRRKTFLAPLEFNLCFLARYQVNTANHLFSVFLSYYGVFSNRTIAR